MPAVGDASCIATDRDKGEGVAALLALLGDEQGPAEEPLDEMMEEPEIAGTSLMHSQDEVTIHMAEEEIRELRLNVGAGTRYPR